MAQQDFLASHHIVNGVYPVADAFATSVTTDYVSLANYRKATWVIHTGVATGGTANGVITVLAGTDASGTSAAAVPFKYRRCASSTTVDTWGALTDVAATGLVMTVGSNQMYEVEVTADQVEGVDPGNPFVALKVTEDTNDPVVAGIIVILSDPRYGTQVPDSAIA
jgi:hypothetical protein